MLRVLLPEADATNSEEATSESGRQRGHGETVLVVEDEAVIRELTVRMLGSLGYRVHDASGGDAAMAFLRQEENQVDLVLTDVVMPGLSGARFLQELQGWDAELPVILMSGHAEDRLSSVDWKSMTAGFLRKPFSMDELAESVHRALR